MSKFLSSFSRLKVDSSRQIDARVVSAVVTRGNRLYFTIADGNNTSLYDVFANKVQFGEQLKNDEPLLPVRCIMKCDITTSNICMKTGVVGNRAVGIEKIEEGMVFGVYNSTSTIKMLHPMLRISTSRFIDLVEFEIVYLDDLPEFGYPMDLTLFVDNRDLSPFAPLAIKSSDDLMEYHETNVLMALKTNGVKNLEFYHFDSNQHICLFGYTKDKQMTRMVVDYSFRLISCGLVQRGESVFCR